MAAEKHDCAGHVFGQYRDYPCSQDGRSPEYPCLDPGCPCANLCYEDD